MKERPILFSGEMVRAILDGRKTQTRRVVKGHPIHVIQFIGRDDKPTHEYGLCLESDRVINQHAHCPFGQPGDRLWVRETWRVSSSGRHYPSQTTSAYVEWRAGPYVGTGQQQSQFKLSDEDSDAFGLAAYAANSDGWRPSIHMPRWASRITLEIESVRVERLQDLSWQDARSEGVVSGRIPADEDGPTRIGYVLGKDDGKCILYPTEQKAFRTTWDSIYSSKPGHAWADSPWVWVVSFRRVEVQHASQ